MPRSGKEFSVLMTNCGPLGWVSDLDGGYRYQSVHPHTSRPWPPIPELLTEVWKEVAAYRALPEACLVNYYAARARLGSHRDADEDDARAPVISVSLGDDATFHLRGAPRGDPKHRLVPRSGAVFVLRRTAFDVPPRIDRTH